MRKNKWYGRKMMRRLAAVGLSVSMIGFGFSQSTQAVAMYYAICEESERTEWDWVATARALARAEGTVTASQSDGVRAVKGHVINAAGTADEVCEAAEYFSGKGFKNQIGRVQFPALKQFLKDHHLIGVDWRGTNMVSKYYVYIIGYHEEPVSSENPEGIQEVRYFDPWDGNSAWCPFLVMAGEAMNSPMIWTKSCFYKYK